MRGTPQFWHAHGEGVRSLRNNGRTARKNQCISVTITPGTACVNMSETHVTGSPHRRIRGLHTVHGEGQKTGGLLGAARSPSPHQSPHLSLLGSSFLLVCSQQSSSHGSDPWVAATHVEVSWLQLESARHWGCEAADWNTSVSLLSE